MGHIVHQCPFPVGGRVIHLSRTMMAGVGVTSRFTDTAYHTIALTMLALLYTPLPRPALYKPTSKIVRFTLYIHNLAVLPHIYVYLCIRGVNMTPIPYHYIQKDIFSLSVILTIRLA